MNSEAFPEIGYFFGDGVDDMGNFVADDEFDVLDNGVGYLGGNFVAHKESVFDFDGSGQELKDGFGLGCVLMGWTFSLH